MRSRPALVAALVTAAFMASRAAIKAAAGPDASFLLVDALKTFPRLAAAAACWWAMRPAGMRSWGWTSATRSGAALAAAVSVAHMTRYAGQADGGYSPAAVVLGAVLSVPVALWEELCYRGLLYGALRPRLGPLRAALVSTAVFTVMHWGAMAVPTWPSVFMTGFAFCGALELGAGLPALIAAHWLIDSAFFLTGGEVVAPVWFALSDAASLAACTRAWSALRAPPAASPSPTLPG